MSHAVPDFESHFQNEKFSDIQLVICEESQELGCKRRRGLELPGHSMGLMAFSGYCKTKLEKWTPSDSLTFTGLKQTVEVPVPPGQTDTAVRLIKAMYQRQPDLSDLSHEQLLQLLLLADRFEVPKVQAAVLELFKAVSVEALQWDTALALLDLPASCAEQEGCKDVCDLAVSKLLQQLGDLERVWADEQLQQLLKALPHAALLRLLQHDATKVKDEATVVHTIPEWFQHQQNKADRGMLKQLMQQVRMQHLSPLFIGTVLLYHPRVLQCYTAQQLALASLYASQETSEAMFQALSAEELKATCPAWFAPKRPASSMPQEIQWILPLDQLRDAVEKQLTDGTKVELQSHTAILRGYRVNMVLTPCKVDASKKGSLYLGLFVGIRTPVHLGILQATVQITAKSCGGPVRSPPNARRQSVHRSGQLTKSFSSHRSCWGMSFLVFETLDSWSDVEAALKANHLVHPDSCLHLEAKILHMK